MENNSTQTRTSGLAVASLVLSCLSIIFGPFSAIPGIICGHIAKNECKNNKAITGNGMATAGLIIGYVFLALIILFILLFFLFLGVITSYHVAP